MKQYLDDLQYILDHGNTRDDRTGTGTIGVFGLQTRYDLQKGFPAVTTKKLAWKSVLSELLWFIEGSGDERRLAEILHGDRNTTKKTIWSANADSDYWKPKAEFNGDLGRIYGVQWRSWKTIKSLAHSEGENDVYIGKGSYIDQLDTLISGIKENPYGRRHILSAWNPGELDQMALPPCHIMAQFYVNDGRLSCQMYQRSCDMPLGGPYNIASYSILTHMVAQVTGLEVGEFIHTIGDAHIYIDQVEQANEQLKRKPKKLPTLMIDTKIKNIDDFTMDSFKLENYDHHAELKYPFSV